MQTNIDQNEVKNLWKITYFLKKKFGLGPARPMWLGWTQ
jgi:hypothetical protein